MMDYQSAYIHDERNQDSLEVQRWSMYYATNRCMQMQCHAQSNFALWYHPKLTQIQDLSLHIYNFCFSRLFILLSTAFKYSVVVT
jgi:hypothetical protein